MAKRLLALLCSLLFMHPISVRAERALPSKSFISSLVSAFELNTAETASLVTGQYDRYSSVYSIANAIPLLQVYREILAEYRVPADFSLLPLIESANNPIAQSHKNAVGLWQFIPATGSMHGLRIQAEVDDRKNVIRSTFAAAEHLAFLYSKLGDWVLVVAAYNCGLKCVVRAKNTRGSNDLQKIIQNTPLETREYVRKFFGLRYFIISSQYHSAVSRFPDGIYLQRVAVPSVNSGNGVEPSFPKHFSSKNQVIRFLNIGLDKDAERRGSINLLLPTSLFNKYFLETKVSFRQPKRLSDSIDCNLQSGSFYSVKAGESLHQVALKARVSVDKLRELNGGISSTRPGMLLKTCHND